MKLALRCEVEIHGQERQLGLDKKTKPCRVTTLGSSSVSLAKFRSPAFVWSRAKLKALSDVA
jgi:hypothetical protein